MRKALIVAALVAIVALPLAAQEYTGCCYNAKAQMYYLAGHAPPIFGQVDPATGCVTGDAWSPGACPESTAVPTAVPTPPPPPTEGGLWPLIVEWANRFTIWKGDAASVAKIIAVLFSFLGVVQAVKKLLENAAKWEWILKLIPQLAVVFNFLAHGIGPIILNALITGGTMLIAAVQDGALSLGEVLAVLVAVLGVDLIYRLIRKYLFPKTA